MKVTIKTGKPNNPLQTPASKPLTPKSDSIITKVIRIVIDDIVYRLHGIKSKDREKWETYQKFCELAKGGMK